MNISAHTASIEVTSPLMRLSASWLVDAPPWISTTWPILMPASSRMPPSSSTNHSSNMPGRWRWVSTTTLDSLGSTIGFNGAAIG